MKPESLCFTIGMPIFCYSLYSAGRVATYPGYLSHRESTLEWLSTVQSRLCGWCLRVSTWFIFQSGIYHIAPVANLAVQSFSSMRCTQRIPTSSVNHFHPPGPLHVLHDLSIFKLGDSLFTVCSMRLQEMRSFVGCFYRFKNKGCRGFVGAE